MPHSHQSLNMFKSCLVKHGLKLKGYVQQARKWLFRPNCFSSSKWAQFRHVAFHFIEKHNPLFKFAGFSFIFHKYRMQKRSFFPGGVLSKESFCFSKQ